MNLKDYLYLFKQLDENKQFTDYQQQGQMKMKQQTEQQKPKSGYLRFYLEKEAQLKEQYPDFSNIEIIQIIVKQWRQLSLAEREKFRDPDGSVQQLDNNEQEESEDFHINLND